MDYSIKAALLASYHPFQMRINILIQQLGHSSPGVVFFNGLLGFVNNVVTRPNIKSKLEAIKDFNEYDANIAIKDTDLIEACKAAWDELGSFISGQYVNSNSNTTVTTTDSTGNTA